ncbi:fungal chitosanase of glycosyl hydrolase group 75-domain-containing protein [Auriculariales sp. MPI-PUGE-AT-0066]|nr:fungal chitosanase of glycosyl hydrolase group 75-domain-containing protein [Auriculariales sp. MPI-PUGE-AT-0066]
MSFVRTALFVAVFAAVVSSTAVQHQHQHSKRATAFQADASIDVTAIAAAARTSLNRGRNVLAQYRATQGGSASAVKIQGDWLSLNGVSAFHFIADMDTDCDGYNCPGNPDGQPETNWGALDARVVPWIVIPQSFLDSHGSQLLLNALSAVICGNPAKMYYAIFGDSNGDSPEVAGEVSLMLAQTCFPNDGLSGSVGHGALDVTYIVWGTKVPTGVGQNTINITALKTLGDQQARALQTALGLGGAAPTSSDQCFEDGDCSGQYCCIFEDISNRCIAKSACVNFTCSSAATGSQGECALG